MQTVNLERYPSIMANHEAENVSDRYSFIPTIQVAQAIMDKGWLPVRAQENRTRLDTRHGFQKHMIRFRPTANDLAVGDVFPELVLTNAHDGTSAFKLLMGLFRLACSNGMVVNESTFGSHSIRHVGYTNQAVWEAVDHATDTIPQITDKVKEFKAITLTPDEQGVFAQSALDIKYKEDDQTKRNFYPPALLSARRYSDQGDNLWMVYNRVQENMLKGSRYEYKNVRNRWGREYSKSRKVRGVQNITEDIRLNKALWTLTEEMAKLKS